MIYFRTLLCTGSKTIFLFLTISLYRNSRSSYKIYSLCYNPKKCSIVSNILFFHLEELLFSNQSFILYKRKYNDDSSIFFTTWFHILFSASWNWNVSLQLPLLLNLRIRRHKAMRQITFLCHLSSKCYQITDSSQRFVSVS